MISVIRFAGTPSNFASARAERPSGRRYSSRSTSPGCVRTRGMLVSSMIVYDLDVLGPFRRPAKADSPLSIDPDAILTFAIALERFKMIAWRRPQVVESHGSVDHIELSLRDCLERPPSRRADAVAEEPFGCPIGEAPDHVELSVMRCITVKVSVTKYMVPWSGRTSPTATSCSARALSRARKRRAAFAHRGRMLVFRGDPRPWAAARQGEASPHRRQDEKSKREGVR